MNWEQNKTRQRITNNKMTLKELTGWGMTNQAYSWYGIT